MRIRDFWFLCSWLAFGSSVVNAQIVTVTTHISACSATYPSRSTTVVASTVTVAPTPWSDSLPNGGTPFVIRLQQVDTSGYPDQTSDPYWLMYNGNTTTDASMAGVYRIVDGQLSTYNGSYISTGSDVVDQTFAVSTSRGAISTFFSVNNGMLNWTNSQFSNGTAQFYKLPPNLLQNAQILAKFIGPMEPERSWSPVILYVDPVPSSIVRPSSHPMTYSDTTGSASSGMEAGSSSAPLTSTTIPAKLSSISTPPSPTSSSPTNATYTGPFVSPTADSRVGRCGGSTGETCSGSGFGNCCNEYGWCGSTNDYCSTGCQVAFGNCNADQYSASALSSLATMATSGVPVSPSSTTVTDSSGAASVPTSMSSVTEASTFRGSTITPLSITFSSMSSSSNGITSMSSTSDSATPSSMMSSPTMSDSFFSTDSSVSSITSSTTSSAPSASATICTQGTQKDSAGALYAVYCDSDSTSPAFATIETDDGVQGCITICSNTTSCLAVTFTAFDSTMTNGFCYLRASKGTVIDSGYGTAFIVLVQPAPTTGANSSTVASSSITSSGITSSSTASSSSISLSISGGPGPVSAPSNSSQSMSGASSTSNSGTTTFSSSWTAISSSGSQSSSLPASSVVSSSDSVISSSTSVATPSSTCNSYTCPEADGTTITTCNGTSYTIGCNQDTTGGGDGGHESLTGFSGCFSICDSTPGCQGFTFSTQTADGAGFGFCYLKIGSPEQLTFLPNDSQQYLVAAIIVVTSSSSSASQTSSSGVITTSTGSSVSVTAASTSITNSSTISGLTSSTGGSLTVSSTSTMTGSGTASSYSSSYTCPSTNFNYTTDAQGNVYQLYNDTDAMGNSNNIFRTEVGISECMSTCDVTPGCTGWTYRGFDSTDTTGYCYLRTTVGKCSPSVSGVFLGILVAGTPTPYPSTSSVSSSTTSSPSVTPTIYSSYVPSSRSSSSSSSSSTYVNTLVASNTANVIPSPTLCDFGDPPSYNQDDNYCEIDLPFPMQLYDYSDTHTFASTNGFVSLTNGSAAYNADALPSAFLPPYTLCPFYDDLYIYRNRTDQNQGLYYSFSADNTAVYYEWILSRPGTDEFYHFTAYYAQAEPGVVTFAYYASGGVDGAAGDDGGTASVGVQGEVGGQTKAVQFSFDEQVEKGGVVVRCDTTGGGDGSCSVVS